MRRKMVLEMAEMAKELTYFRETVNDLIFFFF